eukprot:10008693-Karenia_brevis.AAC.1
MSCISMGSGITTKYSITPFSSQRHGEKGQNRNCCFQFNSNLRPNMCRPIPMTMDKRITCPENTQCRSNQQKAVSEVPNQNFQLTSCELPHLQGVLNGTPKTPQTSARNAH